MGQNALAVLAIVDPKYKTAGAFEAINNGAVLGGVAINEEAARVHIATFLGRC